MHAGALSESEFDEQVLTLARRIDVAKWWIDNRSLTPGAIREALADPGIEATQNENPY